MDRITIDLEYTFYFYTIVLTVFLLIAMVKLNRPLLYFITGLLLIGYVVISQLAIDTVKGYPVHKIKLDREVNLVYSYQKNKWVYIWVNHPDELEPRVYRIPATKKNKSEARKAKEAAKKGLVVKVVPSENESEDSDDESELTYRIVDPRDIIKKGPIK